MTDETTTQPRGFFASVLAELSRRRVPRTLGGYAVVVFVLLQLMDGLVEPLRMPDWLPTLIVIALILGFPVVFLLAWHLDVTADGVRRTESAGLLTRGQTTSLFAAMLVLTGSLAWGFYHYYFGVFEGAPGDVPTQAPQPAVARSFNAPENSIAVLPFSDMSVAGDHAYLSDGVAEEILNLLARVDGLHVAARTSSFAFRDREADIREIGRLLNVRTVLEGSVRTSGDRIRLTAQLINVDDGYHIWSETYDRQLDDVFEIQDEVASAIAGALLDTFEGVVSTEVGRTDSLAAFEAYRTGRLHWWRRSPEELQRAVSLFAEALEHDSAFPPAYAALADSWLLLSQYGNISLVDAIERAQPLIEKALALDPESAEAFAALGLARWQIGQVDAAESALRQAVSLNGDYIPARLWLGGLLGELGRFPEQSLVLEEAMQLDPLNELLAINYASNLYTRGRVDESRAVIDRLLELKPDSTNLLRTSAEFARGNGDLVRGWRDAARALDLEPDSPTTVAAMASAWLDLGAFDRAEELVATALETSGDNMKLRQEYFTVLLVQRRYEKAEAVLRESYGDAVDALPEQIERLAHHDYGLLALLQDRPAVAAREFEAALPDEQRAQGFDTYSLGGLTMAAVAHQRIGNAALAEQRLDEAERALRRAEINGVDNLDLHYLRGCVHALRGEPEQAMASLSEAYRRGFRSGWAMKLDERLAPIRELPAYVDLEHRIDDEARRALAEVRTLAVAYR